MKKQTSTGEHATRQSGESTGFGVSTHHIMAAPLSVIVRAKRTH